MEIFYLIILFTDQLGLILERIIILSKSCAKPYHCFIAVVFNLLFCRLEKKTHEFILDKSVERNYKKNM
jgi:hypothetical protein